MNVQNAISCNCSICIRRGTLLDFVPETSFKLLAGKAELQDYQFNKKIVHHLFCKTCGVVSFSKGAAPDGTKMVAINLRCIENIDLSKLTIQDYDGRSF